VYVTIVLRDPGDRHRFIEDAFTGCESLKTIVIPNSVKEIGGKASKVYESLHSVGLPNTLAAIENGEFASALPLRL
jgi:hypothetical protein